MTVVTVDALGVQDVGRGITQRGTLSIVFDALEDLVRMILQEIEGFQLK
jgi:hypothetical protein